METCIEGTVSAWRSVCFLSNAVRYLIVFSIGVLGECHLICCCFSVTHFALHMYEVCPESIQPF